MVIEIELPAKLFVDKKSLFLNKNIMTKKEFIIKTMESIENIDNVKAIETIWRKNRKILYIPIIIWEW